MRFANIFTNNSKKKCLGHKKNYKQYKLITFASLCLLDSFGSIFAFQLVESGRIRHFFALLYFFFAYLASFCFLANDVETKQ